MNNYETANAIAIGEAQNLILGVKPENLNTIDSLGWVDYLEPIADIEETE
jgi:hypothetical protein